MNESEEENLLEQNATDEGDDVRTIFFLKTNLTLLEISQLAA